MTLTQNLSQLSVVIPVYNEGLHLEERVDHFITVLDAVVGSGRWEICLINNGSADNTATIIDNLSTRSPISSATPCQTQTMAWRSAMG